MKGFFAAPSRTPEELEAIIRNYRLIALASGLAILSFGIVRAVTQPEGQDPLLERFLIALACVCFAILTAFDNPIRRNPAFSMTILASIIFGFIVHLTYLTQFSVNSSFAVLLASFLISLVILTRASLVLFQATAFSLTAIMMFTAETTAVSPLFFLATLLCVCVFTYLNQMFRMDTEENLRQARQEAMEAAEARTQFLANMSHEIRTPMNGVIGMTHLLGGTTLDATQRSYLKTIQVSGESLLNIINDILDFSKVDAGEINLDFHQFDLTDCIENAVDLVKQACRDKQLGIHLILEPGVPQSVYADSNRLRQVMINLLNNAVKFTSEGHVTLRVSGEHINESFRLKYSVSDTGIGIPQESMDSLFQAFSQVDSSTTRKYGGTGLGLSISKHLIELMDGSITVESEVGNGTTFSFDVPVRNPIHQTPNRELQTALDHLRSGDTKIMLYLENPLSKQSLVNFLEDSSIPFKEAESRSVAANIVRQSQFEVAFTDAILTRDLMSRRELIYIATSVDEAVQVQSRRVIEQPIKPSRIRELILDETKKQTTYRGIQEPEINREEIRILLAEDNVINQRVATKMLEKYGYEVDLANDGAEALAAIRNNRYDLVLMDIQMPELSGLEVTERVRSEGESCPIVALTANAFEEDRQACLSVGMDAYISKPIRNETLDHVIQQTIRH